MEETNMNKKIILVLALLSIIGLGIGAGLEEQRDTILIHRTHVAVLTEMNITELQVGKMTCNDDSCHQTVYFSNYGNHYPDRIAEAQKRECVGDFTAPNDPFVTPRCVKSVGDYYQGGTDYDFSSGWVYFSMDDIIDTINDDVSRQIGVFVQDEIRRRVDVQQDKLSVHRTLKIGSYN